MVPDLKRTAQARIDQAIKSPQVSRANKPARSLTPMGGRPIIRKGGKRGYREPIRTDQHIGNRGGGTKGNKGSKFGPDVYDQPIKSKQRQSIKSASRSMKKAVAKQEQKAQMKSMKKDMQKKANSKGLGPNRGKLMLAARSRIMAHPEATGNASVKTVAGRIQKRRQGRRKLARTSKLQEKRAK